MGAGTIEAAAVGHDGEAVLGQAASPRFENARDLGHHLEGVGNAGAVVELRDVEVNSGAVNQDVEGTLESGRVAADLTTW